MYHMFETAGAWCADRVDSFVPMTPESSTPRVAANIVLKSFALALPHLAVVGATRVVFGKRPAQVVHVLLLWQRWLRREQ